MIQSSIAYTVSNVCGKTYVKVVFCLNDNLGRDNRIFQGKIGNSSKMAHLVRLNSDPKSNSQLYYYYNVQINIGTVNSYTKPIHEIINKLVML
jgi:hypothetical protein